MHPITVNAKSSGLAKALLVWIGIQSNFAPSIAAHISISVKPRSVREWKIIRIICVGTILWGVLDRWTMG